jgi:hypothetical protein
MKTWIVPAILVLTVFATSAIIAPSVHAQAGAPPVPCFLFTQNGGLTGQGDCNFSGVNGIMIYFRPGSTRDIGPSNSRARENTCLLQWTFFGYNVTGEDGNATCRKGANALAVRWHNPFAQPSIFRVFSKCYWIKNEHRRGSCEVVDPTRAASNGFLLFAQNGITRVAWTMNGTQIGPAILPNAPANNIEFRLMIIP